jgi:hypothetical protein
MFRRVGLQSLIRFEDVVYPRKVREFFCNFHIPGGGDVDSIWRDDLRVTFALNEQGYTYDISEFGRLMGFQSRESDFYFYSDSVTFSDEVFDDSQEFVEEVLEEILEPQHVETCLTNESVEVRHIKPDLVRSYRVIRENVTCRQFRTRMPGQPPVDSVSVLEALMVYWVMKRKRVNMGFIMANVLWEAVQAYPNCPIPYGMRLTHLFRELGVLTRQDGNGVAVPRIELF